MGSTASVFPENDYDDLGAEVAQPSDIEDDGKDVEMAGGQTNEEKEPLEEKKQPDRKESEQMEVKKELLNMVKSEHGKINHIFERLTSTMKKHRNEHLYQTWCCVIIRDLVDRNRQPGRAKDILHAIQSHSSIDEIISAMSSFPDDLSLQVAACGAIWTLSTHELGADMVRRRKGVSAVIEVLANPAFERVSDEEAKADPEMISANENKEELHHQALGALRNLVFMTSNQLKKENMRQKRDKREKKLEFFTKNVFEATPGDGNLVALVVRSLSGTVSKALIADQAIAVLYTLLLDDRCKSQMVKVVSEDIGDGMSVLLKAMEANMLSLPIQQRSLLCMKRLCNFLDLQARKLFQERAGQNGIAAISSTIKNTRPHALTQVFAMQTLKALTKENGKNKVKCFRENVIPEMNKSLQVHLADSNFVEAVLETLQSITSLKPEEEKKAVVTKQEKHGWFGMVGDTLSNLCKVMDAYPPRKGASLDEIIADRHVYEIHERLGFILKFIFSSESCIELALSVKSEGILPKIVEVLPIIADHLDKLPHFEPTGRETVRTKTSKKCRAAIRELLGAVVVISTKAVDMHTKAKQKSKNAYYDLWQIFRQDDSLVTFACNIGEQYQDDVSMLAPAMATLFIVFWMAKIYKALPDPLDDPGWVERVRTLVEKAGTVHEEERKKYNAVPSAEVRELSPTDKQDRRELDRNLKELNQVQLRLTQDIRDWDNEADNILLDKRAEAAMGGLEELSDNDDETEDSYEDEDEE